jgi:hypothetical protein
MPTLTATQRAAQAAANAQATADFEPTEPRIQAHATQAAEHVGATANAPTQRAREAHANAAEAHETAAQDQAAYLAAGDPDGAPGLTATQSARAWMLTAAAEATTISDGGYRD